MNLSIKVFDLKVIVKIWSVLKILRFVIFFFFWKQNKSCSYVNVFQNIKESNVMGSWYTEQLYMINALLILFLS